MASLKELSGVAHNIAHHSSSCMSWLHPHMAQACRMAGVTVAEVELLEENPYPIMLPKLKPLEMALRGLQTKFWEIVDKQDIPRSSVQSVRLTFHFFAVATDNYWGTVNAIITATNGRVFHKGA